MSAVGSGDTYEADGGQEGMSLRDYFAAKAMHAELATAGMHDGAAAALAKAADEMGQAIEERVAFNAYAIADAMLAARDVEGRTSDDRARNRQREDEEV